MSVEQRRTDLVRAVIHELVDAGRSPLQPGDVSSALRQRGQPLGTWEVRREFARLGELGELELDPASGSWSLTKARKHRQASG